MRTTDLGRFLPRGGETIPVTKVEDAFTARIEPEAAVELALAEPAIAAVEPLTESIARVTVDGSAAVRDQLMAELREEDRLVVHHEYAAKEDAGTTFRLTDEVIVAFDPELGLPQIGDVLAEEGLVVHRPYPHLGRAYLCTVTEAAQANPVKVANRLAARTEVDYAEPALVNRFELQQPLPTDPEFANQWHLLSAPLAGADVAPDADASVAAAWELTRGSRDVVVAVLDDGFDLTHPDFQGAGKVVEPVDFRGGDPSPLPEGSDYHGTPCAGVAIAEENADGCVGVAPLCAFMPVRFPLSAQDQWLIEIFRHVSARANVASCSWGPPPANAPLHSAVRDTLAQLARTGGRDGKGLVIVFAAGNYDAPLDATVAQPVRWGTFDAQGRIVVRQASGRIVNGFAAHPDVVAVSACTSLNRKSLYSNWGPELSVCAPSDNWHPITYDRLPGRGITTTDNEPYGRGFTTGKRWTNRFGGTSSATPLVAGVCGLVKSANPDLTAPQIRELIESTAHPIVDPSIDELWGHSLGTYANGVSGWFGRGRVNARAAVEAARARLEQEVLVEVENTTRRAIPDNSAAGIGTSVTVVEAGSVADLAVDVAIAHSWIGDLEVALLAPDGRRAELHRRAGSGADDIRRTFASADVPALAALVGAPAQGQWTLHAADRAPRDAGTLERWALRLRVRGPRRVVVASTRSVTIPDAAPAGATSRLDVAVAGLVVSAAVTVDVTHPFVGDLRVALVAPDGTEAVLQNRQGGQADNLVATFVAATTPGLAPLAGRQAAGAWTLEVADLAPRDVGKLNAWTLELALA